MQLLSEGFRDTRRARGLSDFGFAKSATSYGRDAAGLA